MSGRLGANYFVTCSTCGAPGHKAQDCPARTLYHQQAVKQLAKDSQDPQIVKEVYGKAHSVAVMRLTFLIGFLLLASFALGQAGMVQSVASIGESGGLVKVIPFAPVVVCGYPANTSSPPCSNLITTYTTPTKAGTCSSSTQVIWPGTSTCQSTADPSGNFAFFADTGQNATYYFKYLSVWFGPFAVVVGGGGGTPGGSNGQVQFNNGGVFGGVTTPTPIINLFSGCSGVLYLGADGACHVSGASPWNSILAPTGNASLSMGTDTTLFSFGDYGASPTAGIYTFTDSATSSTDTSTNVVFDTGGSSKHNPLAVRIQGTNQFQVCEQPGPQGQLVIGSAVGCAAINQSPFAKFVMESNTGSHNNVRVYQKSASATGTMLEMNNATASSSAYNFFTACSGASATDTSCASGTIVAKLDGRGFFTAQQVTSPIYTGLTGVQLKDGPGTSGVFISGGDVDINDIASNQINLIGGDVGSTVHGSLFLGGSAQGVDLHSSDGNVQFSAFQSTLNAIATLSGTAFTTNVNLVAPTAQWTGITGLTQCLHVNSAGVVSGTGVDCGAGGGGTPGGATLSFQYNNAGAFAGPTVGVNKGFYVFGRQNSVHGTPVAPNEFQVGDCVSPGSISGAGTSYTVVYTDVIGCNVVHDRAASGAATITIPTPATLDNPTPFFFYSNYSAQSDTLTPTTYTISQGTAAAGATLTVPSGVTCKVLLDTVNASTWKALCNPMSTSAGGGTTANALTMNNSNSGAASGTTFDGSVARTISTNTIGAANLGTANTFGAFLQDFSASTIKLPVGAGFTTTAQGNMGYDSTNLNWHVWQNAADRILPPVNGSTTNGNCVKFVVSGSTVSLQDAGASCVPTIGFLWLPFATTGEPQFTQANQTVGSANQPLCKSFQTPAATITPGHITVNVNALSVGQSFNVAIYDNSGNLLKDSGSMSCTNTNAVTATFSGITLQPNTTYAQCVAITDTTCALAGFAPSASITNISNKNATRDFNCANSLSAGAMPSTCGTPTPAQNKAFLVLLEP
jgi:hypothetical protein